MHFFHTTAVICGLYIIAWYILLEKFNIKGFVFGYFANIIGLLIISERLDSTSTLGYLIIGLLVQYNGILRFDSSELVGYWTSGLHIAIAFLREYNKWQNRWQNKAQIELNVAGTIVLAIFFLAFMKSLRTRCTSKSISILPLAYSTT